MEMKMVYWIEWRYVKAQSDSGYQYQFKNLIRRVKPVFWEWNIQFIQHSMSYFFHGFDCNITWIQSRNHSNPGYLPRSTSELRRDLTLSICQLRRKFIRVYEHPHTNMSLGDDQAMVSTGRFSILKSYKDIILKHTSHQLQGSLLALVQYSAYLIHNIEFTSRTLIPTELAWIQSLRHVDILFR